MDLVNMPVNCLLTWRGKVFFCACKGTGEVNIFLTEFIASLSRLFFFKAAFRSKYCDCPIEVLLVSFACFCDTWHNIINELL